MAAIDEQCEIVLGPGNEVTNVPQNEQLLELIQQAPIWETEKVLQLSQFYQAAPGTSLTGKHVALVGLAMQAGPQAMKTALLDYQIAGSAAEAVEYILNGGDNPEDDPDNNDTIVSFKLLYRRVPVNGIGLLVETFVSIDEKQVETTQHFIIGVAPAL